MLVQSQFQNVVTCLHWLGLLGSHSFSVSPTESLDFCCKEMLLSLSLEIFEMLCNPDQSLLGHLARSIRGTCHCNGGKPACTGASAKKTNTVFPWDLFGTVWAICCSSFFFVSLRGHKLLRWDCISTARRRTKTRTAPRAVSSRLRRSPWTPRHKSFALCRVQNDVIVTYRHTSSLPKLTGQWHQWHNLVDMLYVKMNIA